MKRQIERKMTVKKQFLPPQNSRIIVFDTETSGLSQYIYYLSILS
jgi:hypothetical protein